MICVGCQHEWEGVTPLGHVDDLECPDCHAHKGTTKYTVGADTVFQCQCGCQYFLITPDKTICANCGIVPVSY